MGGLTFSQDAEGNWGYRPSGADAVVPFNKKDPTEVRLTLQADGASNKAANSTTLGIDLTGYSTLKVTYVFTPEGGATFSVGGKSVPVSVGSTCDISSFKGITNIVAYVYRSGTPARFNIYFSLE